MCISAMYFTLWVYLVFSLMDHRDASANSQKCSRRGKAEREGTKVQRLFMLLLNACRGPESKSRHVKEEG